MINSVLKMNEYLFRTNIVETNIVETLAVPRLLYGTEFLKKLIL